MKIGYKSDSGIRRNLNEDSIAILKCDVVYESERGEAALLVVADGVGGRNAGEEASYQTAKRVIKEMTRVMLIKRRKNLSSKKITTFFQEIIKQINRDIFQYVEKNPQYNGMGTTVTAAVILESTVYIGHVGDSRAYIINNKEINQITKDHSLVQEMVDRGEITQEQARTHPQRNVITRVVGLYPDVDVDTVMHHICRDDYLLLCCDGLTDVLTDEEIHTVFMQYTDPQVICDTLVEKIKHKGGSDNISVIVVQCDVPKKVLSDKTHLTDRFTKDEETKVKRY